MIEEALVHERAANKLRGALLPASVSDQLTISSGLIERVVPEDWPLSAGITRCPWLPFVRKQLQAIKALPAGWDSYGGPSPDARLVASAQSLIECLAQVADLPQPHVNPTRNGGVQFEWEAGDRYFELEVVAERAATYLYCDDAARVEETGNVFEQESLEPVLAYIRGVGTLQ